MERVGGRRAVEVDPGGPLECWFTAPHRPAADRLVATLAELGCEARSVWDFCGVGARPALPWTVVADADPSVNPLELVNAAEACGAVYHPTGGSARWSGT